MSSIFCPLDDRYYEQIKELGPVGEMAFMKYRLEIEIKYFLEMVKIKNLSISSENIFRLNKLLENDFTTNFKLIKEFEKKTKHDVKAVEYFLRDFLKNLEIDTETIELVHYGLTSQDINTPALSLQLKHFHTILYKQYTELVDLLNKKYQDYQDVVFLGKTHGQPAIPTKIGNQFKIVSESLKHHLNILYHLTKDGIPTKFGGAVGHLNAHYLTDPEINWHTEFDKHISDTYQLQRIKYTTQNLPYTYWSPIFDAYKNINCIVSDFCQDIWLMISNCTFNQRRDEGQVDSSSMPQKINPIDFENSEGNADMATNMFEFFSRRLSRSRLQRDLTDSTILRNLAMPFGYSLLSSKSLIRGLNKITPNLENIRQELIDEPTIISEGLQTILRDIGYPNPYEVLRKITQTNHTIGLQEMKFHLIDILENEIEIEKENKNENKIKKYENAIDKIINLTQFNYIGKLE